MLEARIAADLELGRQAELVGELFAYAETYPFREQMIAYLVLALYRTGRRADALEAYQRFASRAAEELGIDPGPALRELHERVLNDDATLLLPASTPVVPPKVGVLVPAQLPPAPVGFTGRGTELEWLDAVLAEDVGDATPVAVLSGLAGVGKTALATVWAHRVAARFPDGQLFVDLRGLDPGDVLTRFLVTLGVPAGDVPADRDDRAALYRSLLAHRRVLVVLDDARDSEQIRLLLPAGSRAFVLITSRVRLAGMVARNGARLLEPRPLPLPEATRIIAALAGPGRIDQARLDRLATLCGCLPLALRIVGARLAERPDWTVDSLADSLVDELADERTRLAALAVEQSNTSVRAALDVTYRWLGESAAWTYRLLGLVPGPSIGPELLAALRSPSGDVADARRSLRVLASAFLVTETERDVFVMNDLVRLHAKELAPVGEERTVILDRLGSFQVGVSDSARRPHSP
ncbi:hypothetical protein GCM10029964_002450 [Kibdelosporangium lantanae]